MAIYKWEIPFLDFPDVVQLLVNARAAEDFGDRQGLSEMVDRIKSLPGYPMGADPTHDTIMVVPKNAAIRSNWGQTGRGSGYGPPPKGA